MDKDNLIIIYTEEVGGDYHVIRQLTNAKTQELFDQTVASGVLIYSLGDGDRIIKIKPAYLAITEIKQDWDFVLGGARDGILSEEGEPDGTTQA